MVRANLRSEPIFFFQKENIVRNVLINQFQLQVQLRKYRLFDAFCANVRHFSAMTLKLRQRCLDNWPRVKCIQRHLDKKVIGTLMQTDNNLMRIKKRHVTILSAKPI